MTKREAQRARSPFRGDINRVQEERMPQTYRSLVIPAVFSPKDRRPLLTTTIREELFAYMGVIIGRLKG